MRRWLVVALLALAPATAAAQTCSIGLFALIFGGGGTCTASTTMNITIGTVMQLSLNSSSTALTPPTSGDYDAGYRADVGPVATARANQAWRLQVAAQAATWTATNSVPGSIARANKPAADLTWSTAVNGSFAGLSTTGVQAGSGSASAGTAVSLFYRTLYAYSLDTPGSYSLTVVFTMFSP